MSINNINNPAIIAKAVAAAIEEMKIMTDAEVHMWAGQWAELALKAPWNEMSAAMATVFGDENRRRIASK
jgi:ketopantoate reductase